jgi:hypothetical protein
MEHLLMYHLPTGVFINVGGRQPGAMIYEVYLVE